MHWFVGLVDKLTSFIPRPWLVFPDEGGVRVTARWPWNGVWIRDLEPGLYWYVPLFQQCENIKVKVQVQDLRCQSVWTKDGHELAISGTVRYRVDNPRKAILEVFDPDQNVQNTGLRVIFRFVTQQELAGLRDNLANLEREILAGLREASRGWGLKIEDVGLTDIGRTRNFRLLTNESLLTIKTGE